MSSTAIGNYIVELFFETTPHLDAKDVLAQLGKTCGKISATASKNIEQDGLVFTFLNPTDAAKGERLPTNALICIADGPPRVEDLSESVQQNWEYPDLNASLATATVKLLIIHTVILPLPSKVCLRLVHEMVLAVLQQCSPIAIHWAPSGYIVPPNEYLDSKKEGPKYDPVFPAFKVRSFNISNEPDGAMIIDTLGGAALGVPDVQCHFRDLDADNIANTLNSIAYYLFDSGDVIEDGETVQGISENDYWKCEHQASIAAPERMVLDVDPGRPFNCR